MRSDHLYQVPDGQTDFSGGMRMIGELGPSEYRYGRNIIVRNGDARTRPGVRRQFKINSAGFNEAFFFNQENEKYNDTDHTGFWFAFDFVGTTWKDIQGMTFFRFLSDTTARQLVVSDGTVFIHNKGYVTTIDTAEVLTTSETIVFVQGNNKVVMLRSSGNPLFWDGAAQSSGFQSFTSPGTSNRIPLAANGEYMYSRLLLIKDRDDVYVSDSLDFDTYDYTDQLFSVRRGDGDELMAIVPFKKKYAIAFKKNSISVLTGLNEFVDVAGGDTLANHVEVETLSTTVGIVGSKAYAVRGEEIYFLSYKGVTSVSRSAEGEMRGEDIPLSAPIQPLIDEINWQYAYKAVGAIFNNYLLFSVPTGSSTLNNKTLVYDFLAANGQGAWVSEWTSDMLRPVQYFEDNEKLYFLNQDGALKIMWSDDSWDTEDVFDDVSEHDISVVYNEGDRCYSDLYGEKIIYRCLFENKNTVTSNTTYWVPETDVQNLFHIDSEIWAAFYVHGDEVSPKRWSRGEIVFAHHDPKISVTIEDEDYGTLETLYSDKTYSQTSYDIAGVSAWGSHNAALDFGDPHRQDYALMLDTAGRQYTIEELSNNFTMNDLILHGIPASGFFDGMFIDKNGIDLDVHETHSLPFIPRLVNNRSFSLRIRNTQGKIRLKSIILIAQQSHFAKRDR